MRKQIVLGQASRDPCGDPDGVVSNPRDIQAHASLVLLMKEIGDRLERMYPGWAWGIEGDEAGGIVNVKSLRCSSQWGFTLKIGQIQNDPQLRDVMRMGGELIERFGYRAGPFNHEAFRAGPRHLGKPVADVSDMASRKRRDYRTYNLQRAVEDGRARILTDTDIARAKAARTP